MVEELANRKMGVINGLWANSNYDGKDVDRMEIVKKVEEAHDNAILSLKYGESAKRDEPSEYGELDKSNPFFGKISVPELDVAKDAKSEDWYKDIEFDQD
jgi:hypothetical protein